jgi:cyclopropane fatty-acyl-phospholipid synthase-like methyltransferase
MSGGSSDIHSRRPKLKRKDMMYTFTDQFMSNEENLEFLKATMMGPNAMRVAEEFASHLDINEHMRILDLGCGTGLSTLLLVKKYGVTVFAADLWISPTENYERFQSLGIDDQAIPIFVDATKSLPFANGYFDVLFSVDAYHYFGDTEEMLSTLIPFVKKGGYLAVAIPGLKFEFGENVPVEMQTFWNDEVARTIHSIDWWKARWRAEKGIDIVDISEMACCKQAWDEWLTAYHPVVKGDIEMMKAEGGKYFNFIQLIAKVV